MSVICFTNNFTNYQESVWNHYANNCCKFLGDVGIAEIRWYDNSSYTESIEEVGTIPSTEKSI